MKPITSMFAAALALVPVAGLAQGQAHDDVQGQPAITIEDRMLLRCSAAFAIAARRQQAGDTQALAWPDLRQRGSEYFVRASAQVMDRAGLDREEISRVLTAEAQDIVRGDTLARMMPHCLLSLEASKL